MKQKYSETMTTKYLHKECIKALSSNLWGHKINWMKYPWNKQAQKITIISG